MRIRGILAGLFLLAIRGFAQIPPDEAGQQKILTSLREFAHGYLQRLPDFICTRSTAHKLSTDGGATWKPDLKVDQEMTFRSGRESFHVTAVNDRPSKSISLLTILRNGGYADFGDTFGTLLAYVFDPDRRAELQWRGRDYLHGKPVYAVAYHVALADSIAVRPTCTLWIMVPTCKSFKYAYSGIVYIDAETHDIARITHETEGLAEGLMVAQSVDFSRVAIAGVDYLLPAADRFETRGKYVFRNESVFSAYRKFGATSSLKAADAAPPAEAPAPKTPRLTPRATHPREPLPLQASNCFELRDQVLKMKHRGVERDVVGMMFNERRSVPETRGLPENGAEKSQLETALASVAAQTTVVRKYSRLTYVQDDEGIRVPLSVNGRITELDLDTGAGLSLLSEAEANRLGLEIKDQRFSMTDIAAKEIECRLGLASELSTGDFRLRNVPFCVAAHLQEEHGTLGLPVLLAFETMRWNRDGSFEIGFRAARPDIARANLCIAGGLAVQAEIGKKRLVFDFDTGNGDTLLYPEFAADFPDLLKSAGTKRPHELTGVAGSTDTEVVEIPLTIEIGGHTATLKDVAVLSKSAPAGQCQGCYGNAGRDLFAGARAVTLDFKAMMLSIDP